MIEGVRRRELMTHADDRGSLTEVFRSDWPEFEQFGQAIATVNLPGVIRGWHWHYEQTDVIVVIDGSVVLPLYDGRSDSPTQGVVDEHISEPDSRFALFVPPGVWHGYKTLGDRPAIILNFPSRTYDPENPDEERVAHATSGIPYDWSVRT